jgi:hypothetical protein
VTHEPPRVSDEVYGALAEHFDRHQRVQISLIVGLSALVNRVHVTFLTDPDPEFLGALEGAACPIPIPAVPSSSFAGEAS